MPSRIVHQTDGVAWLERAALPADEGQRRGSGMGAALGAAGDVEDHRAVEDRGGGPCHLSGDRASRHQPGGAGRSARAGDDGAARIVGPDDEAEGCGMVAEAGGMPGRDA